MLRMNSIEEKKLSYRNGRKSDFALPTRCLFCFFFVKLKLVMWTSYITYVTTLYQTGYIKDQNS